MERWDSGWDDRSCMETFLNQVVRFVRTLRTCVALVDNMIWLKKKSTIQKDLMVCLGSQGPDAKS